MELLFLSNSAYPVDVRQIREEMQSIYDFDRGDPLVHVGAYCLMPNHFHILVTPAVEGGIQTFMRKVSTGYSMYFNKRYERTGVLFQGRYKSQHADTDVYLKYLFSYIHLNPLKLIEPNWKKMGLKDIHGGKKYLDAYVYSSYLDFLQERARPESLILDISHYPDYFPDKNLFIEEIEDWLTYEEGSNY
jgi:putative transposase